MESSPGSRGASARELVLLASVFGVAIAGLVYELVAGTLSTYLLGGSVLVFSLVIGWTLFAMGVGAWLAQYVDDPQLGRAFVWAELLAAVVGGTSGLLMFAAYATLDEGYPLVVAVICGLVGIASGAEIPLLLRIFKQTLTIRLAISQVLAVDYLGALVGSVAFPLLLLPYLGSVRAAALFGGLNAVVALVAIRVLLRGERTVGLTVTSSAVLAGLLGVFWTGGATSTFLEDQLYESDILVAKDTPYQRLVVTRWRDDVRLYLNGHLQFATMDEYRYHETLVFPALAATPRPGRVLILGGGDGLAVQRVLTHPGVVHVDLVDLDPEVMALFRDHPRLSELNQGALRDARVTTHAADAIAWLRSTEDLYDVILIDLPDPNDPQLARLYAQSTYRLALERLAPRGALVTQATSPFYAPDAFWCIATTLEAAVAEAPLARTVHPGHVQVPTFGEWGFVLVTETGVDVRTLSVPDDAKFLTKATISSMWDFPADMARRPVQVNRLSEPVLARYYRQGWAAHR
ncbi:MAG: polyamine aminopropyltransferase [Myxococcota bacterium]